MASKAEKPFISEQAKFQAKDLELALSFADSHEHFDDTFLRSLARRVHVGAGVFNGPSV